ncbi:MAG: hypothetical protein LUC44_06670 [Prevotellaceae bacterium]|nr:hypothetical protein [Prevotellaceae bacterium]
MRLFQDTQENINNLIVESGNLASLYKRYVRRQLTERSSEILSTIAIAFVLIVIGGMVLLLLFIALGYVLGSVFGSLPLGFLCVTALALLLMLLVYCCRHRWIVAPLTRLITDSFDSADASVSASELHEQFNTENEKMRSRVHALWGNHASAHSTAERASRIVYHAVTLYDGFRLGLSTFSVLRSLFGRRKRKGK